MQDIYLYIGEVMGQAGLIGCFMAIVGKVINIIIGAFSKGEINV